MGPAFDSRLTHAFCFSSECFLSFKISGYYGFIPSDM